MTKKQSVSLQPIGERLLIELPKVEEKTSFGIILTDSSSKAQSMQGVVVALGGELSGVSVGDTVFYIGYDNQEVEHDNAKFMIVKFENVTAVVNK